jgi:opacity protein-like surface antigen
MFTSRVGLALNWDDTWDTSTVGSFELTSIGHTSVKNHLQNFIVGPRVYFTQKKIKDKYVLTPFGEAQFGLSHLSTRIQQQATGEQSASDTAFTWMVGAGADYVIAGHWAARANLDLLRTHFVDAGQSRLRFVLGIAYTIRRR